MCEWPQAAEAFITSVQVMFSIPKSPAELVLPSCLRTQAGRFLYPFTALIDWFLSFTRKKSLPFRCAINKTRKSLVSFLFPSTNNLIDPLSFSWCCFSSWYLTETFNLKWYRFPWPWQQVGVKVVSFMDTLVIGILDQSQGGWGIFLEPH